MSGVESAPARVLIGGVGYRWMRDASFGVIASDALAKLDWPSHVDVADLGYGAILIAQDLMYATPRYTRLVLVAAVERGRAPGTLYTYRCSQPTADAGDIHARIAEAGAGVLDVDHLLVIAAWFGVLPADVAVVELEPVDTGGGEELSAQAMDALASVADLVRGEALRPPESQSSFPLALPAVIERESRRRTWSSLPY